MILIRNIYYYDASSHGGFFINYARKNGSRVAGFITLFGDNQRGRGESWEQIAQKAAIRKGFVVFIVSILDKVPYSKKP